MINNFFLTRNVITKPINDTGVVLTGYVTKVKDGIALIKGLNKVRSGEVVLFEGDIKGMALNLMKGDEVSAVIFGDVNSVKQGSKVKQLNKLMTVKASTRLLGSVLNSLGEALNGVDVSAYEGPELNIEKKAVGIVARQSVFEPLLTGWKAIDALIPIGRGQRELIIGDRQTGKTSIAIDAIINQLNYNTNIDYDNKNVYCIYVAIGQKKSTLVRIVETLRSFQALKYTIIVTTFASESASLQYLAPYTGTTLGEYFRDNKKHCLIIYDDLTKHAIAYRQMSLLLRRSPGREAYPGDVFYLHSRLLERSAKLSDKLGGGSLTALPIIETLEGDVSAYIPTNVISITDGQIFLDTSLFYSGIRPAINIGLSVSRVGAASQPKLMKSLSSSLKVGLAQFREVENFANLGADVDPLTQHILDRGYKLTELFIQNRFDSHSLGLLMLFTYAGAKGFFDDIEIAQINKISLGMIEEAKSDFWSPFFKFLNTLSNKKKTEDLIDSKVLENFLNTFTKWFTFSKLDPHKKVY